MSKANPLRPGEGKRTVSLETVASQQQVEEHKLRGKREAYMKRHELYVKSMYGNVIEKEQVRQKQRALLQEQIAEQDNKHRQYLDDRYKESNFAIHYDEACRRQDAEDRNNRKAYLQKFRDENKRLMETRAEQLRREREAQHQRERELLALSPINWTKTLH
ncbi:trichohyalin [Nematostella vectensis]|nr:trichohyalin [Nematostella vectensis]